MAKNTKRKILNVGIMMWLEDPMTVNAHAIAKRMGMTHGAVLYHFPEGVKDSVALHAVKTGNSKIICQLIVADHIAVEQMNEKIKAEYLVAF